MQVRCTAAQRSELPDLAEVLRVHKNPTKPSVPHAQVRCPAAQRRELSDLAEIFHGTVCDVSLGTITLEIQGKEDKMHALQGLLEPYGAL